MAQALRKDGSLGERALKRELNGRGLRRIVRARPRRRAAALGNQTVEVDIGNRHVAGEKPGRSKLGAVLVDEVLARKNHVGRGLALACVRVGIGAVQARALIGDEAAAVICLADDFVRGRRVEDHRCTSERHLGRGRRRHPQVLTNLDAQHQVLGTLIAAAVDKPRAKRHRTLTGKFNPHGIGRRRSKPAALIKLAVVGQILFGRKAQKLARTAHGRAVVDILGNCNGKPDGKDNRQLTSLVEDMHQSSLAGMQQRAVMEQIGRGIAAQVKLGQHQRANATPGSIANSRQRNLGIALDIGHANLRRRRRHTQKAIRLRKVKIHKNAPVRKRYSTQLASPIVVQPPGGTASHQLGEQLMS